MTNDASLHPAHKTLIDASSVKTIHVWVESRWLFIETDTQAVGVCLADDLMDEVHVAEATQVLESLEFIVSPTPGWFGAERRTPIGELDLAAIREVVSKLRRATGTKTFGGVREYEFAPDSVLATNRYTLARRPVATGITTPFTLTLNAVDAIMASQAEHLTIRLGERSVAYVLDGVAHVEALRRRPMSLHEQVALIDEVAGEPQEMKRLEFGRMVKAVGPDRDDRRVLSEPYIAGPRHFEVERVTQAFGTLAGPTITWRLTPRALILDDTLSTRAYVQSSNL